MIIPTNENGTTLGDNAGILHSTKADVA